MEGLEGGRFAILTKTHHAMVDGVAAVDIGQVILDVTKEPRDTPADSWRPSSEPSSLELVAGAVGDLARGPSAVVEAVRAGVADVRHTAGRVLGRPAAWLAMTRTVARQAPATPLNVEIGEQRRYGMAATRLADYKAIRKAHGGTVNDVVLAVVSGALRAWMLTRGEAVTGQTSIRAMVPVSVGSDSEEGAAGNRVSSYLVDLPVGEASAVDAAASGVVCDAGAQGDRAGRRRGRDHRPRGVRPADPARAGRAGRVGAFSPAVQRGRDQRARPAVPRCTPVGP